LWHYPVILLLEWETSLAPWQIGVIAFAATFVITAASWRYIETPFLRLKTRYEPRPPASRTSE
jgi:peptidoglycan/LPS O-acetylase OafA/YrhL